MPNIPKIIDVTITSGVKGQPITLINRNNGESIKETIKATAAHAFDAANLKSGYTDGHVYDIIVAGERVGAAELITSGDKGQKVTVGTTAVSNIARGF